MPQSVLFKMGLRLKKKITYVNWKANCCLLQTQGVLWKKRGIWEEIPIITVTRSFQEVKMLCVAADPRSSGRIGGVAERTGRKTPRQGLGSSLFPVEEPGLVLVLVSPLSLPCEAQGARDPGEALG